MGVQLKLCCKIVPQNLFLSTSHRCHIHLGPVDSISSGCIKLCDMSNSCSFSLLNGVLQTSTLLYTVCGVESSINDELSSLWKDRILEWVLQILNSLLPDYITVFLLCYVGYTWWESYKGWTEKGERERERVCTIGRLTMSLNCPSWLIYDRPFPHHLSAIFILAMGSTCT